MNIKTYLLETRPQFLILPVVLSLLGTSIAWYNGYFHLGHALLGFFGLLLAHAAVNILNDYHDFKSGLDLATQRTPFSGGSGMLPSGRLTSSQVLRFGLIMLGLAVAIGIYFIIVIGWLLLPLLLLAGLTIVFYTPFILKRNWPEWSPGVGLGVLPVLGAYFIQTGFYDWPVLIAAIPSGILVHNLLFLNEFPDAEADVTVHRKTLPVVIGKRKASGIYLVTTLLVYAWIIAWTIAGTLPWFALAGLLTLPLAFKAIGGARNYDNPARLMPALGSNVMVVLLTQLLMGVGYILAVVF